MNENTKARVLLVDDEPSMRTWIKGILIKIDCDDVIEGQNGREAIDLYTAESPDIVILDIHMPEVDGRLALSHIKTEDPDAYVVMLTSIEDTQEMLDRFESGAEYYLLKHKTSDEIEAALREQIGMAMERKRSRSE